MFMGALLLLAALLAWGTALTLSPHGQAVAEGTEHVRTTVVTFKRNGAIGTLILCAIAAWLLFPMRRPKWPARDWSLIALLAFLAGSSTYTLIWLQPFGPVDDNVDANVATTNMNMDWNAGGGALNIARNINMEPMPQPRLAAPGSIAEAVPTANDGAIPAEQDQSAEAITDDQAGSLTEDEVEADGDAGFQNGGEESVDNEPDENQE
jgi:hypothetical protein